MDKIICVGKNYLAHAQEMGDVIPEKPVLFLKPPSVIKQASTWGETLTAAFPNTKGEVQPEIEIVLRLSQGGYQMNATQAHHAISAVTLGLDMTLRTRQTQLKKQGHPWTTAKVFPDAAIIGPWIKAGDFPDFVSTDFSLVIDDNLCQLGRGADMLMSPQELVIYLSHFFPLCAGDIIFTGTPAGVSPINVGSTAKLQWNNYYFQTKWQ